MCPRVLLVDDVAVVRSVLRDLLLRRGFVICGEASGAAEALSLAMQTAPDAALVDVRLGEDDGFQVAARLTRHRPALSILLTSATFDGRYYTRAQVCGARGYVPKALLATADLHALWTPASGAQEPSLLGAGDRLRARGRPKLAVDAVRLGLDGVG